MGIFVGILLFMVLVIIHELGHFWAAKKSGVKVYEFGIGIPPKLFKFYTDKDGTEYTINAIPLGGFVKLKGEDPTDPQEFKAKDSLSQKPLWKKLIVIFGGVTMNFIFAYFIFVFVFWKGVDPIVAIPDNSIAITSESYLFPSESFGIEKGFIRKVGEIGAVQIETVFPDTIAEKIGLLSGDIILTINNVKVDNRNLSDQLLANIGKTVNITYQRGEITDNKEFNCPEDNCLLGIQYIGGIHVDQIKMTFTNALIAGFHEIGAETKLTFFALGNLGKNLFSFQKEKISESVQKLTGPVGITKIGENIFRNSFLQYLAFGGMISLALALFNILPIPALDGGRGLSMIIQSTLNLNPEKYFVVENYINLVVFVLLLIFGVYIILLDLVRFYGVPIPGIG